MRLVKQDIVYTELPNSLKYKSNAMAGDCTAYLKQLDALLEEAIV